MKQSTIAMATAAILLAAFASAGEAAAGPESKCQACHTFDQGGKHKTGPNLFGIVGARAGSTDFAKYSDALKNGNWTWNDENLKAWVCDSNSAIKTLTGDEHARTKMGKQNKCGDDADAIVAFLNTMK